MAEAVDKSQYVLPLDQPFVELAIEGAFNGLSEQEKLYAHHISKASWAGGLVTFLQVSVSIILLFTDYVILIYFVHRQVQNQA